MMNSLIRMFLLAATCVAMPSARAQSEGDMNAEVIRQVDGLVKQSGNGQPVTLETLDPLFRAAIQADGSVETLLDWLLEQRGKIDNTRSASLAEIEVHVAARRGDLNRASEVLNELLDFEAVASKRLDLRIWQAKLFDALGNVEEAKKTYQGLIEADLSESDQQMVRLRLALMGLIGAEESNPKTDAKALIELATKSKDNDFRNRTANVLAVQNQHVEAIKIFSIQGEGTQRFRSASRLTEWAIRANDRDKAIESGWEATHAAELKRDRRYALALLVETYRMVPKTTAPAKPDPAAAPDKAKTVASTTAAKAVAATAAIQTTTASRTMAATQTTAAQPNANAADGESPKPKTPPNPGLIALAERFEKDNREGKPLTNEMRAVWVDLLRELERHDDAIRLFKSSADSESGFSIEMRRELLEMEGAAGNVDRLIASYRELIDAEPDQLTWRGGLTRLLLEQGKDDQAADLWRDYVGGLNKGSQLLMSAQTLGNLGMDEMAESAVERMVTLQLEPGQGLLYLADLQQQRGRVEAAEATLNRLNEMPNVGDAVRSELASAFERVGRQGKAIEVTEQIRANRESVAEDVEMRLAWLYSEVGDEDKALEQWLNLWRKVTSIPRRRYIEDRLMTVASRLGTLADIAIELEEKLADGKADDREAGLLVRIYSRVNDSVAASEILEEYMTQTGRNQIERLQEKGRIYQICNDYWNYEKVVEQLIEVDPDGETEYLRQLALSMLERGKAQEARSVLLTLRDADDGKDSIGGEFEAGVLSLVGLNREAADAYRRGIATHPDRIESYLLLANLLKDMSQTDRAVGMFQYLAENADRDDLFTIAIDGLLNMEAKGKVMQWARRITLERLAGREDKNYLYQLLSDLSSEVNDKSGQIRAMENSLAVSGTRRLSVLRECMDLSSRIRGGVFYSSSSRGPTNARNKPFFAFGRRLIGLGELMPPQVFLDLGQAFLADGDVGSADRTFGMARNLADERAYQREVASIFEKAGKRAEALVRYDRLLRTSPSDVPLMARVAKLNEQEGKDDVAFRFYQRGLNLLLAQTPLTTQEDTSKNTSSYSWSGNRDTYQTYSDRLLRGMLVTVPNDAVEDLLTNQRREIQASLDAINERKELASAAENLSDSPRLSKQSDALRRIYFAFQRIGELESLESILIAQFKGDEKLVGQFARDRISHGRYDSVGRMLASLTPGSSSHEQVKVMLGESTPSEVSNQLLAPKEMWQQFLPVWMGGDMEEARSILRRVDQSKGVATRTSVSYMVVNGVLVPQQTGSAANVSSWMRMALHLKDEGLALQFARSRLQKARRYGATGIKQLFDGYRAILPDDSFRALVRYAANLYKDDEARLVEYLWIISQLRDELDDDLPSDEKLLEMIEESDLSIGYQFTFALANEAFPESIRGQAMGHVIEGIDKKSRPRELVRIPFQHDSPIDPETAEVILDSIKSGIQPALQDKYLQYAIYYLPRQGKALRCPENADLAIAALELLDTDTIRKRDERVAAVAKNVKAVILHQSGRTEEALELILPTYDPEKSVTDYYHRYSRDWVWRELIIAAPERFLAVLDSQEDGDKRTIKQTDRRLAVMKQSGNDELLRQGYQQAIKDHPDQTKYVQLFERWEQRAGRIGAAIAIKEQELAALPDDDAGKAKAKPIKARLGALWFSVDHRVNGLPFWSITDDEDRERFEAEVKKRNEAEKAKAKEEATASSKAESDETKDNEKKKESKDKDYPKSIAGVKAALTDSNEAAAQSTLRGLWRAFPMVVESPYRYSSRQKSINGLRWPADAPKKKEPDAKPEPTEEERLAAAEKLRRTRRGGLGTFVPAVPRPPAKSPRNAWNALADQSIGVDEMKRIKRSRTRNELAGISEVVLGLLQAERNRDGDDAVFDSLVGKLNAGQVGDIELMQFFHMLDEDTSRITEENVSVIDTLLDRLDLTQLKMASQLAKVCSQVGQNDRAAALYRHCALLSPSQGVTFQSLLTQASKSFEGQALMDLAEEMFALVAQTDAVVTRMLDMRMEHLPPAEVAKRSQPLFTKLNDDPVAYRVPQAIRGARLFSEAGQYDRALECLECALRQHGKSPQQETTSYYYYGTVRPVSVSHADLFRLFPSESDRHDDYDQWLKRAAQRNAQLIGSEQIDAGISVPVQALIASLQIERGDRDAAAESLACLTAEVVAESKAYELLAIDVLRQAGLNSVALEIESSLHERKKLSHLRYGDLVRDTAAVVDNPSAMELAEKLFTLSLDQDLMAAAEEIAVEDTPFAERLTRLVEQRQEAEDEYKERVEAAASRKETRASWRSSTTVTPKP